MAKSISLGTIDGLECRVKPSAIVSFFGLWLALAALAWKMLHYKPSVAVGTGFVATLLHFLLELWHQIGHGRAAKLSGYSMKGITFNGPIAMSIYPRNEPAIPADIHIQRALGGPVFSALLTVGLSAVALLLKPIGGPASTVALFALADNIAVFNIGALLPLGFTDGSTLLEWWPKRSNQRVNVA